MADKGVLDIGEGGSLSALRETQDGYSSIRRGVKTLYPVKTAAGKIYFSRVPLGDKADGNSHPLVDYAST